MLKKPTIRVVLGILVAFVSLLSMFSSMSALADADYDQALKTAPQGVKLTNIFQIGTTPSSGGTASSAKVQAVTNPKSPGTDAVIINTDRNQIGYIWSAAQNSFDLHQDSKSSMWMYFGNRGAGAGDGMAFVLQNDPNQYAARPQFIKDNVFGETVGVWGVDGDFNRTNPAEIAKTAIQNSWALEFDTYPGNTSDSFDKAGQGDSFDLGVTNQAHIAANYPGDGGSYQEHWKARGILGFDRRHYFSLNHQGLLATPNLSNGQWHHLSLDWNAETHKITYTFDDKNADGSLNKAAQSQSMTIDPDKFKTSNGKVLWGFTGATGGNFENNMVIFESVQGLVTASATAAIHNHTLDKPVKDGDSVHSGDELTYQYHLKYESGKQEWSDVIASLDLAKAVHFKAGKITYADGSSAEIPIKDDSSVKYQLLKSLSKTNQTADIELTGQASDVDHDTKVDSAKATFHANNFVTTTATPSFVIQKKPVELQLALDTSQLSLPKGKDAAVKGKLTAKIGDFVNDQIKVQPTLNGQSLDSFNLKKDDSKGALNFKVAASDLKVGDNELTLVATDQNDNQSNNVKLTIRVLSGDLKFGKVADRSTFKPTNLTGQTQLVLPADDWQLQVVDERGKGSNWQLLATATPFKDTSGRAAHGGVVYVDGQTTKKLTDQNVVIQNYQTAEDEETYDAAKHWSTERGLRYQVNAGDAAGEYSGKVTWSLVNAPS